MLERGREGFGGGGGGGGGSCVGPLLTDEGGPGPGAGGERAG